MSAIIWISELYIYVCWPAAKGLTSRSGGFFIRGKNVSVVSRLELIYSGQSSSRGRPLHGAAEQFSFFGPQGPPLPPNFTFYSRARRKCIWEVNTSTTKMDIQCLHLVEIFSFVFLWSCGEMHETWFRGNK